MAHSDHAVSDHTTTTTTTGPGGGAGLGVIVGALVVVVGLLAFFVFGGETPDNPGDVSVTIEGAGDAVQGAGEAVENATDGAAATVSE